MDWHNFKVMFMYGFIVFVILVLGGKTEFAFIALIGYSLYGLMDVIKAYLYKSKLDKELSPNLNEELRQVVLCHITQRARKINKKTIRQFVENINNGNYTVKKKILTVIHKTPPTDGDSGYDYHLEFDGERVLYSVDEYMANKCDTGDVLFWISTGTHSAKVIKSASGYHNLFYTHTTTK